jgi:hypothetical protein
MVISRPVIGSSHDWEISLQHWYPINFEPTPISSRDSASNADQYCKMHVGELNMCIQRVKARVATAFYSQPFLARRFPSSVDECVLNAQDTYFWQRQCTELFLL